MPLLKTPRDVIRALERAWTRKRSLSLGYGVPGLDFDSGAALAFARLPDPDGRPTTWLWHRDSGGCWTSYRDGSDAGSGSTLQNKVAPATPPPPADGTGGPAFAEIRIGWRGRGALSLSLPDHRIHWSLRLSATPRTRALTILALMVPDALRQVAAASSLLAPVVERLPAAAEAAAVLSVRSPEGHMYRIEPRRVWLVEASAAVVGGRELGSLGARAGVAGRGGAPSASAGDPVFLSGRTEVDREGRPADPLSHRISRHYHFPHDR